MKEGGAVTVLVSLPAKFPLPASHPSFGHSVTRPTRHGREGGPARDGTNADRPRLLVQGSIFLCIGFLRRAVRLCIVVVARRLDVERRLDLTAGATASLSGVALRLCLLPFPRRVHRFPSSPDLGKTGKGKVLSLATPAPSL